MSVFHDRESNHKSLTENGLCFGAIVAIFAAVAVALQWVMHVL